ncbi:hypothetical protein [Kribbella sp. NPDC004536]|uniref:hypothetical protein n=1 Tax=Kribbella sp. NPDC004536 TaxID=3364106 RepID=UPI0036CDA73F
MLTELPRKLAEDAFWTRLPPPVISIVVIGTAIGGAALLGVDGSDGTPVGDSFVEGVPWTVWRATSGVALVVFAVLVLQAIRILQHPGDWGFHPKHQDRVRYLVYAIVGAAAAGSYRLIFPGVGPDLPVRNLDLRTAVVLVTALAAAVPWMTVVWLAHAECRDLANNVDKRPEEGNAYARALQDKTNDPQLFNRAVAQLNRLWQLLWFCALTSAFGVIAAVASAGALRGAFISVYPDRAREFPPANVLLYGALFTLALSVIAVPFFVAWRNRAGQLADHVCPLPADGNLSDEWMQQRKRVEHLLHLGPLFADSVTAIGVLAPLVVSAIAAFLPKAAN